MAGPSALPRTDAPETGRRRPAAAADPVGQPGSASDTNPRSRNANRSLWLIATVSLVTAGSALHSRVLTIDSYYDLYAGRYIAAHGLPHYNVATAASYGVPWVDQQWLAHLTYYGAWLLGGYPAAAVVSTALVSAGYTVLALTLLRLGVPAPRTLVWTALAFLVCLGNYQIQAQDFGYPLLAMTLLLLLDDRTADRMRTRTWLVVPVLVLWANLHGSVLIGAGMTACYAGARAARSAARRDRRAAADYLGLTVVAAAAVLCTPYGTAVLGYYRHFAGNAQLAHDLAEWAPPNPHVPATWIFAVVALAVVAAVAVAWRRGTRPDPLLAVAAAATLALALAASRNEDWFALVGSLLAADALARAGGHRVTPLGRRSTAGLAGLLATSAIAALAFLGLTPTRQFEAQAPTSALDAAARIAVRHPTLRILGDPFSGSAMLWLHRRMLGRVGFDARMEAYSQSELAWYFNFVFLAGPDWQRATRGYGIVVIAGQDTRLRQAMAGLEGWRAAFRDSRGSVFVRTASGRRT